MSAGEFRITNYETDVGIFLKIRVQPETITTFNPAIAGTRSEGLGSARVSGGVNQLGIRARQVVLKWATTPPAGYKAGGLLRIPVLSSAAFDSLVEGTTVQYLETDAIITSKRDEVVN